MGARDWLNSFACSFSAVFCRVLLDVFDRAAAEAQATVSAPQASASSTRVDSSPALDEALKQERLKSTALEEENKALRGQVATVLSYLDQVMPMDGK